VLVPMRGVKLYANLWHFHLEKNIRKLLMIYLFYEVSNIDWYTRKDINFSGFKDQNITMHVVDSLFTEFRFGNFSLFVHNTLLCAVNSKAVYFFIIN